MRAIFSLFAGRATGGRRTAWSDAPRPGRRDDPRRDQRRLPKQSQLPQNPWCLFSLPTFPTRSGRLHFFGKHETPKQSQRPQKSWSLSGVGSPRPSRQMRQPRMLFTPQLCCGMEMWNPQNSMTGCPEYRRAHAFLGCPSIKHGWGKLWAMWSPVNGLGGEPS